MEIRKPAVSPEEAGELLFYMDLNVPLPAYRPAGPDQAFTDVLQKETGAFRQPEVEYCRDESSILPRLQSDRGYCQLMIADYRLTRMNGIEFLEIVRRLNPEIRLVLTAESLDADLEWYLNNRIVDRIVLRQDIAKELSKVMAEKELSKQADPGTISAAESLHPGRNMV